MPIRHSIIHLIDKSQDRQPGSPAYQRTRTVRIAHRDNLLTDLNESYTAKQGGLGLLP